MAALNIKNIPTGPGDDIKIDASYAKGTTKNVIATSGTSPSFAMFGGSGSAYQSVGFGATTDGVYVSGGRSRHPDQQPGAFAARSTTTGIPYWSTSLFGSYSAVRYDDSAKAAYCTAFNVSHPGATGVAGVGTYSCNPDFNVSQLGVVTRWTPVKNLTFSGEVQWFHLDQKMAGSSVFAATSPKPAALYEFKDQDTVLLQLRAQRNF